MKISDLKNYEKLITQLFSSQNHLLITADKLMELANIILASTVFSQLFQDKFQLITALLGIILFIFLYVIANHAIIIYQQNAKSKSKRN